MIEATRLVVQLAVGIVFLVSALGKARNPGAFVRGVADYEILPPRLSAAAGVMVILVEGLLAFSHLTGLWIAQAVPLAVATLAVFLAAVEISLRRHRDLPCFCFGDRDERVSGRSVAQLLLLLGAELLLLGDPSRGASTAAVDAADLALALTWAVLLLIAARWLLAAPDLAYLWKQYRCKACMRPNAAGAGGGTGGTGP